MKEDYEDTT